jgi:hypothetical protein
MFSGSVTSKRDEHPLKAFAGSEVNPEKYFNSLNDVICVLFWNVVPNCAFVTCAAWLGLIPVPSPQFVAQICPTTGSANTMYDSGTPSCTTVSVFVSVVPWCEAVKVTVCVLLDEPVLASEVTVTVWEPVCDGAET